MTKKMTLRIAFGAMAVLIGSATSTTTAKAATATDELRDTPFEVAPNTAAVPRLVRGGAVRRSSLDGGLTGDDWMRIRALGFERPDTAFVVLHHIPSASATNVRTRQVARLRALTSSVNLFAPSKACDEIVREGNGTGLCTGTTDGPFGSVRLRMGVAASLTEDPRGAMHLIFRNERALEAKALISWSRILDPNHLKIAVDLYPTSEGWFVYTRVAVEMREHKSSAKTITNALLKLDTWLCEDLTRS